MNKYKPLLSLVALAGVLLCGCNRNQPDGAVDARPTSPVTADAQPPTTPPVPDPNTTVPTPVKDALTTLFAQDAQARESIFPKGTHLLGVAIENKLATVDVSKEFNQLQNRGESYEGAAQKKLCAALAPFHEIDTMRLTVEGKDYESQAADWRKVPVRLEGEGSKEASAQSDRLQKPGKVDR